MATVLLFVLSAASLGARQTALVVWRSHEYCVRAVLLSQGEEVKAERNLKSAGAKAKGEHASVSLGDKMCTCTCV